MKIETMTISDSKTGWESRLFVIAGSFMLINTLMLWVRMLSGYQLSILWAAIPAIIALATSVVGLLKLYPRIATQAPMMAKAGAGFALLACVSLGTAAAWIFVSSVFGDGMPAQRSQWFLLLIEIFMSAMVFAFLCNAVAFIRRGSQQKLGYLLSVPLLMWLIMLVVGVIKGMEAGLSLDFYTNGVIGVAFLTLGVVLKNTKMQ